MILDVTADQIAHLTDTDLRALVGYLCESEVRAHGHSSSAVTWGGHQNAPDGGIDVRVALSAGAAISGYVPKATTGFQVKAQDMPHGAILQEMAPGGFVQASIADLAANGGAYIIVSSKGSLADTSLTDRKAAMAEAVKGLPSTPMLDFYDRRRVASWVNQHPGLMLWVRERLGLQLSGWRPFEDWSSSPASVDAPYLLDAQTRLFGPSIKNANGIDAEQALAMLRDILSKPKGVVRLVGLSGVGKTRLIQALFDNRVGNGALAQSDALYTDISDNPDPLPQEMLSRLVTLGHRVVLIVDNCGIGVHKKLVAKIASSQCLLSIITVEYDINDDEPQDTEIFTLEPAAPSLIEKLLENRYRAISQPSRDVITRFSEGNARVAFALAETAKHGESLARLNDTDLFERLFHQQKAPNVDLLDAAKACALLYSFDGETLDGNDSELVPLSKLAGQTVDQLHKHIAELRRRELVQERGQWRAVLPHALANRLAKRALEDIALQRIEDVIVKGSSARMLRSFSRRIGYLHDDSRAISVAAKWFAAGGLLAQLGKLDRLGEEIFENIAPVNPAKSLAYIEGSAAANGSWFFDEQNSNRPQIVRILRSLAYDPDLFERSATLLKRFALSESSVSGESASDSLKSLFALYLSGTHATAAQRATFVKALLESVDASEQALGLELLGEMLKSYHFTSSHSFEFGAWKRDYGFHPTTSDQIRDWYGAAIETGRAAEASVGISSARLRHVMASHVAQLLKVGMFEEVISLVRAFAAHGGWPEGWIGVRAAIRRGKGKLPAARLEKLAELEEHVRPRELAGLIRSYALSAEWGSVDIADLDEEEEQKPGEAREKVNEVCIDLGRQLARDSKQFEAMLPEIVSAESQKTFALGRGLGLACSSATECWSQLREAFLKIPLYERRQQFLAGFLHSAKASSPTETETLLDEVLIDAHLQPYLMYWQVSAGITGEAFNRIMKAIELTTVPVATFSYLAGGRAHEGLDDNQFNSVVHAVTVRAGGNAVAAEILGMRFYGRRSEKLPVGELLKTTARAFLAQVKLERGARLDHLVGQVIEEAFDKPEYEVQAREFCVRLFESFRRAELYVLEFGEILAALTKTFPRIVLDIFVEQAIGEKRIGRSLFRDTGGNHTSPIDAIPESVWGSWAAEAPERRYELLAHVIRFSGANKQSHAMDWSSAATKLIEVAPAPRKVLDIFASRFMPNGWSGSLADTLASQMPLIETLKQHANPEVAAWAHERATSFTADIERQRAEEAAESRARDHSFE